MSWFDTSGLAELAKNALKEAQKTIDKALDIKEEEVIASSTTDSMTTAIDPNSNHQQLQQQHKKSKTEPTTPITPLWQATSSNSALWGSFTGSFFDNPKADEMITIPPSKCGVTVVTPTPTDSKRQSVHSNSDSIEILSSPMTPCSGLTSPSPSVTVHNSESIEIITTPTSSDLLSPVSVKSPDSVEIISSDEILEDDDESMSYNTVMDDSTTLPTTSIVTTPPTISKGLPVTVSSLDSSTKDVTDSCESVKTLIDSNINNSLISTKTNNSIEECNLLDSQTLLSDSTQSFEDVQIPDNGSNGGEDKDLVKVVNSCATSGHTSADEVETTTSSDIEIISNPNGDSSSTNSACRATSPIKSHMNVTEKKKLSSEHKHSTTLNKKGHCREPSEVSTQSDDSQLSNGSETDKLLRRISELSETLEAREIRLIEMGKQNAQLQEKNAEYQVLLDVSRQRKTDNLESEEYTQRLSALEKKFQMSIRERDSLREQLLLAQNELTKKIPKDDLEKVVNEKDFMINELRTEGEKLSKQVLQHSNIIKKLRAKERETDSVLKRNREQIAELTEEVERLKKSLTAKEEVERTQIEAVHKLSSEKRKLERENQMFKNQIEDFTSKLETLQTSFDAAKKELQEKQNKHQELTKKVQALSALETEKHNTETQNAEIMEQLENLRRKLQATESSSSVREQKLRQENADLLKRLESTELRNEQLTQEISSATVPLVRQLEALQSTLASRTNNWENQEKELVRKLEEAQRKLKKLENIELTSREQHSLLIKRSKQLEDRLSSVLLKSEETSNALQQAKLDFRLKENDYQKEILDIKKQLEEALKKYDEIQMKCLSLEKSIELERSSKQKFEITAKNDEKSLQQDDYSSKSNTIIDNCVEDVQQNATPINISPTGSLGRNSIADSLASSAWQMDDLDCISNSGRPTTTGSIYGFNTNFSQISGGHNATIFESLQSTLKQRDGEISQLQWELSRLQIERNALNDEISNLTLEIENLKEKLITHETMEKEFTELQRKYDALLQMYGEKVEEAQELELDLQDVKEMYKAQIDELLKQKNTTLS